MRGNSKSIGINASVGRSHFKHYCNVYATGYGIRETNRGNASGVKVEATGLATTDATTVNLPADSKVDNLS